MYFSHTISNMMILCIKQLQMPIQNLCTQNTMLIRILEHFDHGNLRFKYGNYISRKLYSKIYRLETPLTHLPSFILLHPSRGGCLAVATGVMASPVDISMLPRGYPPKVHSKGPPQRECSHSSQSGRHSL